MTAGTLASILAVRGEIEPALQAFRDALEPRPQSTLSTRCHMADLLVNSGRVKERWKLRRGARERDPTPGGRPAGLLLPALHGSRRRRVRDGLDLAEEQPENERAQRLAQQATLFLGYLPDPPELEAATLQEAAARTAGVALPYLEPPSNYLCFNWMHQLNLRVTKVQKPDPRPPRGRVDYLL